MSRFILIALAASLAATAQPSLADEQDRPNILFIFTDDHATSAVSAYGSKLIQTPNIDRLAREGMRFDRCYATNAICAPSRAVILTGLHSHLNGVRTNRETFDGTQTTFPQLLRRAGYQTAIIGKWHLKSNPTGFDHWEVLIDQGPYYNPPLQSASGVLKREGYTTDILGDRALDWLKNKRDASKPFLLMWQHKAPHREWQPAPRHADTFKDVAFREPPNLFDDYAGRASGARSQEMTLADHFTRLDLKLDPPSGLNPAQLETWRGMFADRQKQAETRNVPGREGTRWRYQCYMRDYLRAILAVDENVGRVLDYLDESGLADDTVVVYASDQGFFLGEHGWYDKRWFYEESARMPLIVRWNKHAAAGSTCDKLVQNLDFAPTFLEIAGVDVPPTMQGRSLRPLLEGKPAGAWRESIYYHYFEFPATHSVPRHVGVRTARLKLIHYYQLGEWELFDLEKDPQEMHNVYADPQYAAELARLTSELERLQIDAGDRLDASETRPASRP